MKKKVLSMIVLLVLAVTTYFLPINTVKAEINNGDYSIEYLLKNYSVITMGKKTVRYPTTSYYSFSQDLKNGGINNSSVEGAVLVKGDYTSNIPVSFGSQAGNVKSFIKGNKGSNVTANSQMESASNSVDFDKMYLNISRVSKRLVEKANHFINDYKLEVSSPGVYTITNTAMSVSYSSSYSNKLLIKNYDNSKYYVFNFMDEYAEFVPDIVIMQSGSPTSVKLSEFISSGGNYSGNIILNYPNAKLLFTQQVTRGGPPSSGALAGNIIAPDADVYNVYNGSMNDYYGSIFANSLVGINYNNYNSNIKKTNFTITSKIADDAVSYIEEPVDYSDDYYSGDYSIREMLQNYSLVTLGHKAIDSRSKLLELGSKPGSVRLLHITGQALIAGDLYSRVTQRQENGNTYMDFERTAFDLESNEKTTSFVKGNVFVNTGSYGGTISVIQPSDNMANDNYYYYNRKNALFIGNSNTSGGYVSPNAASGLADNYINFDRLYNNIVSEQKKIYEGEKVVANNGVANIEIGGNYVIEDINDINEIVFDNFLNNKNMITVITVKNSDNINFPLISKDSGEYKGIPTNDYFGKEHATHSYEQRMFVYSDSYYGNIVWNVPNAKYIKLKENAPFAGHLIAPNADVETPELHFAGCFIVIVFMVLEIQRRISIH